MDGRYRVDILCKNVLKYEIGSPALLLADNLHWHVSDERLSKKHVLQWFLNPLKARPFANR
ncbi:hypothetical protein PHPALM_27819 [Phytophthora palmivora]|uniref:Uncharacterized protein n=1 Tax=Phytophthora palmivora TaxID=4796 RepID=A0A2P4XBN5_9STRA|nr:hypothetical protein PHPALM_27819 [Phytophthora palmivora]